MIEIILNPDSSKFSNILLSIDNIPATYIVNENKIVIDQSIELGLHILRLQLSDNNSRIDIKDVTINGASLRQTLFFSFIEQGQDRRQPATCIWDISQVWVLPFLNPVSHWIGLLGEKLRKDALGTDLSLDYKIYIPESNQVADKYPPGIIDFFKINFGCTIIHKDDVNNKNLPYEKYTGELNTSGVYDEIYRNLNLVRAVVPKTQGSYNPRDDKDFDPNNGWFTATACRVINGIKEYNVDPTILPLTYAFVQSLNIEYDTIIISVSPPRTYAYTHIDKRADTADEKFDGCTKLYIPLNHPKGSMVKFRNVGLLPNSPSIMNSHYYSHAVINDSDETRIVLAVIHNKNR